MAEAFSLLAPELQEIIYRSGWCELRQIQVDAITHILRGEKDLIISAATASGKTEAAFLPTLSKALADDEQAPGIRILYVAPLKALINDQARRLSDLLTESDLPVHCWHGDIPADRKKKIREKPAGVLLITPESLESCFINYSRVVSQLFSHLEFIIIDELHAFISDVRGVHLASLIARIELLAKKRPRRLGLSATLADFSNARSFLNRNAPDQVHLIEDEPGARSISIGLRAYPHPIKKKKTQSSAQPSDESTEISLLAHELGRVFLKDTNLIFTNSRALAELLTEELSQIAKAERWSHNPFLIHHGSLSKEVREETEKRLKKGETLSVFCTSTLEMGIDIGKVKTVGQLSPPWSVASLVQRLGRSGRGEGESAILRMYALDEPVHAGSTLEERLRPQLLRSIAMIELMREKWLEPQPPDHLQLSTFIQQILSLLRQTGGTEAARIYQNLCRNGVFQNISISTFQKVLRSLAAHDLIEQMPEGPLILTPTGEAITHDRDFYAAFVSSEDFSIRNRGNSIGLLPATSIPPPGENFILNGKRWQVEEILGQSRIVEVIPTSAKKAPFFGGDPGETHRRIHQKMEEILNDSTTFPYLHQDAREELEASRKAYRKCGLAQSSLHKNNQTLHLFPWAGTRTIRTLALCAKIAGLKCQIAPKGLSLVYSDLEPESLRHHLDQITAGHFSARELAALLPNKFPEKYDLYLDEDLLNEVNQERAINLDETNRAIKSLQIKTGL